MTDVEIVLADLYEHGAQHSWDWTADLQFARAVGLVEEAKLLESMQAPAFWPAAIEAHMAFVKKPVTNRRLRALRRLVSEGVVEAEWRGTGWGGRTDFGVGRVRRYALCRDGGS